MLAIRRLTQILTLFSIIIIALVSCNQMAPADTKRVEIDHTSSMQCEVVRCQGEMCACELSNLGWQLVTLCEGHEWSGVYEQDGQFMLCRGVSGFAGAVEFPCAVFTGNLEEFKKCGK